MINTHSHCAPLFVGIGLFLFTLFRDSFRLFPVISPNMGPFSRHKLTMRDAGVDHGLVTTVGISCRGVVQFYVAQFAAITRDKVGFCNPVAGKSTKRAQVSIDSLVGIVCLLGPCGSCLIAWPSNRETESVYLLWLANID